MEFEEPVFDEEHKQYTINIKEDNLEHVIFKNVNIGKGKLSSLESDYIELDESVVSLNDIYDTMPDIVEKHTESWFSSKKISKKFLTEKLVRDNKIYIHNTCKAYNKQNKRILLEDVDTDNICDMAITVRGVWFKKASWGIFVSLSQIRQEIEYVNDSIFDSDDEDNTPIEENQEEFF